MFFKKDPNRKKTVFFGPFIGEFGWEILWWQGWVRKVCENEFKDYHKIVASFQGRESIYPYADEYWAHPDHIQSMRYSQRNFMADYWKGNKPSGQTVVMKKNWKGEEVQGVEDVPNTGAENVGTVFNDLLHEYKKKLPKDAIIFCPYKKNYYRPDKLLFGMTNWKIGRSEKIDFQYQLNKPILPNDKAQALLAERVGEDAINAIALFPRHRVERRADKNWTKEKYEELIRVLQKTYPDSKVAVLGEPKGAFFGDPKEVPEGVIDLINVPLNETFQLHVAMMQKARFSLGGYSGSILFSLMCGCPSLTWGTKDKEKAHYYENILETPFYYHSVLDCSPQKVIELLKEKQIDTARPMQSFV